LGGVRAGGQLDDRQQRRGVAAGAVVEPLDRDVRVPALAAGNGELLVHRSGGGTGGGDPDDGEQDPNGDDELAVGENPAGEGGHVFVCITNESQRVEFVLPMIDGERPPAPLIAYTGFLLNWVAARSRTRF